jgi:flagellar basal body-associated protein FliL
MNALLNKKTLFVAVPLLLVAGLAGAGVVFFPKGLLNIKISSGDTAAAEEAPSHATGAGDHAASARGGTPGAHGGREGDPASRFKLDYPTVPYPLRERVVNLADKGGYRYLKVEIVLEVVVPGSKPGEKPPKSGGGGHGGGKSPQMAELEHEMSLLKPRFEDAITTVLTSKTAEELMTTEGKQRLRDELRAKLDHLSHDVPVAGVYFTQFIIQ